MQKLLNRLSDVISSDRFWYAIGIGVLVGIQQNDWKTGAITALTTVLGVGTLDRTVDRVSK